MNNQSGMNVTASETCGLVEFWLRREIRLLCIWPAIQPLFK